MTFRVLRVAPVAFPPAIFAGAQGVTGLIDKLLLYFFAALGAIEFVVIFQLP